MKNLILLVLFSFICGCSTNGVVKDSHTSDRSANALVKELYARGAKPSSTSKLVFRGSEADFGYDTVVTVTDMSVIHTVWRSILRAEPYGRFSACGQRTIEFYSAQDSNVPVATLMVECGDCFGCDTLYVKGTGPFPWDSAKGGRVGLYRSKGLHELVMEYIGEEYERRQREAGLCD